MVKVKLKDVDRLMELVRESNILIYLQNLAMANIDDNISNTRALTATDKSITLYLLDKQTENLLQIYDLLHKEDFIT